MSFLSENVFSSVDTRCYFEGLLPEGFTRKTLAEEGVRLAAKKLGIEVPESYVLKTSEEGISDSDILFATKRFDRVSGGQSKKINNLIVPYRLHQEDFELEAKSIGLGSKIRLQIKSGINRGWTRMCGYKIFSILSKKPVLKTASLKPVHLHILLY